MTNYYIKPKILVAPISTEAIKEFNIGYEVLVLVSNTILKNFKLQVIFDELGKERNLYVYNHIRPDAPFEDLDRVIEELKKT